MKKKSARGGGGEGKQSCETNRKKNRLVETILDKNESPRILASRNDSGDIRRCDIDIGPIEALLAALGTGKLSL